MGPSGRFVVAGESLVDVVVTADGRRFEAPGGSPMNVAVGLARLGVPTTLLTRLGDDEHGRLLRRHLEASDVDLPPATSAARTSTSTAMLSAEGSASYGFELSWDLPATSLPPDTAALHVGSLGTMLDPGRVAVQELIEEAVVRSALVSYDPNVRPMLLPEPGRAFDDMTRVAGRTDVVKLSDEDIRVVSPGAQERRVVEHLLCGERTRLVVVTKGAAGASGYTAHAEAHVAAPVGTVVDTVGAGDSFMAALLAVLSGRGSAEPPWHETELRRLLRSAADAAAVTVSRRGADPPARAELPPGWPGT